MLCKKCKKELQEDWLYCPWCGSGAKKDPKKKMYQRSNGLFEKSVTVDGKRMKLYGRSPSLIAKRKTKNQRPLPYTQRLWSSHGTTLPTTLCEDISRRLHAVYSHLERCR